jgi:hypothetical protein
MDVGTLARGMCLSRIGFGAGLLAASGAFGRFWAGPGARGRDSKVLARAIGVRELVLGAGGLLALTGSDTDAARPWMAAAALAEAADAALNLAGAGLRRTPARLAGAGMAPGNAAVAAAWLVRDT